MAAPVGWYGFYLRAFGAMASRPVEHVYRPLCGQSFAGCLGALSFLQCYAETRLAWSLVMFFFFCEGGLSLDLRRVYEGEAVEPETQTVSN